jgi:hypothetical protein
MIWGIVFSPFGRFTPDRVPSDLSSPVKISLRNLNKAAGQPPDIDIIDDAAP